MNWREMHHKIITKKNGKQVEVSFPPVYILTLPKFQEVIRKAIDKEPSIFGTKRTQALAWANTRKQKIPLWAIEKATRVIGKDYLKLIDCERIYSSTGTYIVFKNKMTPELAYLLGLIITDGHIRVNRTVIDISQNNEHFLEEVAKLFVMVFDITPKIVQDKPFEKSFKLTINSAALRYILSMIWDIPIGEKTYNVGIPTPIKNSTREIKLAFFAGCMDGDGSVSRSNVSNKFSYPRITFKCGSKPLVEGLRKMLQSMGYGSSKTLEEGKKYGSKEKSGNKCYGFEIRALNDVAHLGHEISGFMLSSKKEVLTSYLRQPRYAHKYRVSKDEETVKLIKRARNLAGSYPKLAGYINKKTKQRITNGMLRQYAFLKGSHRPSLSTILCICDFLREDVSNFVDDRTGLLVSL